MNDENVIVPSARYRTLLNLTIENKFESDLNCFGGTVKWRNSCLKNTKYLPSLICQFKRCGNKSLLKKSEGH